MSKRLIDFGGVAVDPEAVLYVVDKSDEGSPYLTRIVFAANSYVGVKVPAAEVVKAINDYHAGQPSPH
jgi:hypothetical protein